MPKTMMLMIAAVAALVTASCGGSSDSVNSSASADETTCTAAGTRVAIASENLEFDKSCLAVPANQDFTITLDNEEGLPHNVELLTAASESIYAGDIITGPKKIDYQVMAMAPGTYEFRCTVHPTQMKGTFLVQ